MKMPLEKARLCLECDTIHDLESCPQCGSATFFYLATWVKPARPPRPERPPAPAPPVPPKKRHWVRNTLLAGASVIAAYQLLFKPSPKKPPEEN